MKKALVIVLLLSAMLFAFAGVALAQATLPTLLLSGDTTGFCDADSAEIFIQVDDVVDLEAYSAFVIYDQRYVSATIEPINTFFDTTGLVPTASCVEYGYGITGVCGLTAGTLGVPVSTDVPETIGKMTISPKDDTGDTLPSSLTLAPGSAFPLIFPSSLNGLIYWDGAINLGAALPVEGCTTAIGGPINLQGGSLTANGAPILFAAATLLGISGLFLAFRVFRKEEVVAG